LATHLFLGVAELGEVVDAVEHGALVGNAGVEVVLLAVLIDAEALEHQPLGESRLQGADLEDRVHVQLGRAHGRQVLLHPPAEDSAPATRATLKSHTPRKKKKRLPSRAERKEKEETAILELQKPAHLNGAAERDLAVALREVHVAHGQISSLNEHGEVHLASPAQILDVAVASILPPRNCPARLRCNPLPILAPLLHLHNAAISTGQISNRCKN
jgi:hypothetical protein